MMVEKTVETEIDTTGFGAPISISVNGYGGKGILFERGFIWIGRGEGDDKRMVVYDKVIFHDDEAMRRKNNKCNSM